MKLKFYISNFLLLLLWVNTVAQSTQKQIDDPIYDYVSQKAQFPGGDFALYEYLHNRIDFSQKGIVKKKEGPIQVNFVVEKDGRITQIELRKGLTKVLNNQVIDAVKNMPHWKPAVLLGKTVRSYSHIKVDFHIKDETQQDVKTKLQSFHYPIQRAMYSLDKERFREAIAYFSVYLSEYPKDSFALYYRGGALYNVNRKREACIDWKDSQGVDSKDLFTAFCEGMRGVKYYSSVDTNYEKFLDTLAVVENCSLDYDSVAHFSKNPDALRKYFKKNMNSRMIKEYRIPSVVLSFNVSTEGKIENIWIVRSYSSSYDAEAIRLIQEMPSWVAATKDGKPVKTKLLFKIVFNDKSTKTGRFIHDFFER